MSETKAMVWIVTVGALLMYGATLAHAQNNNQGQNRNQNQNQGQQNRQKDTYYDQKLGARLKKVPQGYEIVSLSRRGEAAKAGLKKGDIIVDSKPMMQAMVNGKKAPPSTQLNVINGSNGKHRSVDLIGVIIGIIGDHGGNRGGGGNQRYVWDALVLPTKFYQERLHDLDGSDEFKVYMQVKMDAEGTPSLPRDLRWEVRNSKLNTVNSYTDSKGIKFLDVTKPISIYANVTAYDKNIAGGVDQPTYGRAQSEELGPIPATGEPEVDGKIESYDWTLEYRIIYTRRPVNDNQSSGNRSAARTNR